MFRFTKANTRKSAKVGANDTQAGTVTPTLAGTVAPTQAGTLNELKSFLDAEEPQTVKWLVHFWSGQSSAVTYKELREIYLNGGITGEQLAKWQKDYANLVNTALAPQWYKAMGAAANAVKEKYPYFLYDPFVGASQDYIQQHGASLVTELVQEQCGALQAMIAQAAHYDGTTADELSRVMRPVIGLTKPQATANLRYYNTVKTALIKRPPFGGHVKQHPKMTEANAKKKAREAAAKYAAKQHRYRAMNIARTELAYAYNAGSYGATKDAQAQAISATAKRRG